MVWTEECKLQVCFQPKALIPDLHEGNMTDTGSHTCAVCLLKSRCRRFEYSKNFKRGMFILSTQYEKLIQSALNCISEPVVHIKVCDQVLTMKKNSWNEKDNISVLPLSVYFCLKTCNAHLKDKKQMHTKEE